MIEIPKKTQLLPSFRRNAATLFSMRYCFSPIGNCGHDVPIPAVHASGGVKKVKAANEADSAKRMRALSDRVGLATAISSLGFFSSLLGIDW